MPIRDSGGAEANQLDADMSLSEVNMLALIRLRMSPQQAYDTMRVGLRILDVDPMKPLVLKTHGSIRTNSYVRVQEMDPVARLAFAAGVHRVYASSFDRDTCLFRLQDFLDAEAHTRPAPTPAHFCRETGGDLNDQGACVYKGESHWPVRRPENKSPDTMHDSEADILSYLWDLGNRSDTCTARNQRTFLELNHQEKRAFAHMVQEKDKHFGGYDRATGSANPKQLMKTVMQDTRYFGGCGSGRASFGDERVCDMTDEVPPPTIVRGPSPDVDGLL